MADHLAPRIQHAEATVLGRRVPYQVVGDGPPVVLVHGLAGSLRWWCRNVAALAEAHTVYLLNLPGFGVFQPYLPGLGTLRPGLTRYRVVREAGHRFSLTEVADWLTAWIEAVDIGSCHIVAHSMGGHIAIRVAATRPELVQRLVLVAPALVAGRRTLRGYPLALVAAGWAATPSFLPILAMDTLRAGLPTIFRATRSLIRHDIQHELQAVRAPTLMVWGDRDALVPSTWAEGIRAGLPGADLLLLPGAGHVAQYDRAESFNRATLAFLSGDSVAEVDDTM